MLSEHEQRVWDEIERTYRAETGRRGRRGSGAELPAPIIGGAWGAVLLTVFGVPAAGAAIAAVTALMWLLWRFLPDLRDGTADDVGTAKESRPSREVIRWSTSPLD
jgi:hypothetical protein